MPEQRDHDEAAEDDFGSYPEEIPIEDEDHPIEDEDHDAEDQQLAGGSAAIGLKETRVLSRRQPEGDSDGEREGRPTQGQGPDGGRHHDERHGEAVDQHGRASQNTGLPGQIGVQPG